MHSMADVAFFRQGYVQSLRGLNTLWAPGGLDSGVEFGDSQTVVSPALSTAHCLGHTYICSPDNDVDNGMPMLTAWMHPRRLVSVGQAEDCL